MKRKRDFEMVSEIRSAIDELVVLKVKPCDPPATAPAAASIPTKPFLSICTLLLHVLDKIGPSMAVLRQDIFQNIQRLEDLYETNPLVYSNLVEMLKKEAMDGKAKKGHTCSKAFVWLTRTLNFTMTLLRLIEKDCGRNMEEAVDESYNITLKPWHGWISSTAYKVAIKLVPDTQCLIGILMAKDEDQDMLKKQLDTLISYLEPFLEELFNIIKAYGLDKLKCA